VSINSTSKILPKGRKFEVGFAATSAHNVVRPKFVPLLPAVCQIVESYVKKGEKPLPKTFIANLVFEKVRESLLPVQRNDLRLYDSLGTSLDFYHGVDGFFFLWGAIATFDLSIDRGKVRDMKTLKADVLISEDRITYNNSMREMTRRIVFVLKERLKHGPLVY